MIKDGNTSITLNLLKSMCTPSSLCGSVLAYHHFIVIRVDLLITTWWKRSCLSFAAREIL